MTGGGWADLTVVTSCVNYGPYLADWASSLLRQAVRPGAAVIFTHGRTSDEREGAEAARRLTAGGLRAVHAHEPALLPFGTARNRAVALSGTPWVMHLDADDELLPHAVEDFRRVAASGACDIIAAGYERSGDLKAGPRNRTKLYRSCPDGAAVLASPAPCSGVSPFRRSLWERSPYRADLFGGWDTALWLGFGHLGARILPTTRPAFLYRQHADSIFNVRRMGGFVSHLTGIALQGLRVGWSGVSVLVPRSPADGPDRVAAWDFLLRRLRALYPEWEVLEGMAPPGPWCKGAAVRTALDRARGATLVLLDADCVLPEEALPAAVSAVLEGAPWAIPHGDVLRLTPERTAAVLRLPPADEIPVHGDGALTRPAYHGFAGGGAVVVPRWTYEAVGGMPLDFLGWGAEDEALGLILETLAGPVRRLSHSLTHLWHPPAPRRGPDGALTRRNRTRYETLRRAARNPEALWGMLRSGRPGTPARYWGGQDRYHTLSARAERFREEAVRMAGSSFEERRLAAIHLRDEGGGTMAGALDLKRAYARARAAQRERNLLAEHEAEDARTKALLVTPEHKAALRVEAHKAAPAPAVDPGFMGPGYASPEAAALAGEKGLTLPDFDGIEPGPRGFTVGHVRAAARTAGLG